MNLAEQLAELRNNILRDRSDLIAGDADSLWTDATLLSYIKDAEWRFARRTLILRDATTSATCRVVLANGVKTYALHESVIGVLSARYDTDDFDLKRSGHAIVASYTPPEFLELNPAASYSLPPGRPQAFFTDETLVYSGLNRVTMTLFPVPSATEGGKVVMLRVIRRPLTCYTSDNLERESEIPEDYQLDVLEWAAYRALRGFDSDAGSPTKADAHKAEFEEAILRAQNEMKRKAMVATGIRFGYNGFSWTR